jgi:hypothetical protein
MIPDDQRSRFHMTRRHQQLPRLFVALIAATTVACTGAEGPAGPSGGGTLTTATGTGSLILDETVLGYAPLPGVSATVTAAAGRTSDVLIATDGGIQVNSPFAAAVCYTDVAIFVDGAPVGPGRRIGVGNTTEVLFNVGTYGFSVATSLAPGTHTITVQARPYTPLVGVQCYVSSGANGSELPGRPHLQAVLNVVSLS